MADSVVVTCLYVVISHLHPIVPGHPGKANTVITSNVSIAGYAPAPATPASEIDYSSVILPFYDKESAKAAGEQIISLYPDRAKFVVFGAKDCKA